MELVREDAVQASGDTSSPAVGRRSECPRAEGITVERMLGMGGSCTVWLASWDGPAAPGWHLVDAVPPSRFALKLPHLAGLRRPAAGAASKELQALDWLRHEHLVRAYGTVETSHGLGLMLEPYCAGSLGSVLRRAGRLSTGELVTVLTPIATALESLHQQGVVHGDVSPGNILLAPDGKPALGDLADAQALGLPGARTGTEGFIAPEALSNRWRSPGAGRARQRSPWPRAESDVYSLAAVAWFALCGSVPARTQYRAPLQALRPEVPDALVMLLESALQEDPQRRPGAGDFAVALFRAAVPTPLDLTPYVGEEVVPELPSVNTRSPHPRRRVALVAALTLLGSGVGAMVVVPQDDDGDPGLASAVQAPAGPESTASPEITGSPESRDSRESREAAEGTRAPSPRGPGQPSELQGTPEAGNLVQLEDPAAALEGIAVLRTQALRRADPGLVHRYTVEGSPARLADEELIRSFRARGLSYEGRALEIEVQPAAQHSAGPASGEVRLQVRVTAAGLQGGPAQTQRVVLGLQRHGGAWLLDSVEESG